MPKTQIDLRHWFGWLFLINNQVWLRLFHRSARGRLERFSDGLLFTIRSASKLLSRHCRVMKCEQTRALIGFDISRFPAFAGERWAAALLHMPAGVGVGIYSAPLAHDCTRVRVSTMPP